MPTKIQWAMETWNPVTGCTPISEGCDNCYAERMSKRLAGRYGYPADEPFRVKLHPDRLEQPLKWRKPRRIFVCSMGDLFHPDVPFRFVCQIMAVAAACPQHQFLFLTKRAVQMRDYFTASLPLEYELPKAAKDLGVLDRIPGKETPWPLPNVWLGVTAENQARADERIPVLLETPAAVRFVSIEAMLGPVGLRGIPDGSINGNPSVLDALTGMSYCPATVLTSPSDEGEGGLDWVIVGGETGPGARPMFSDWACGVRDQCQAAGVSFFLKQNGEWSVYQKNAKNERIYFKDSPYNGMWFYRVGKKHAGRELDGREWNEYPK